MQDSCGSIWVLLSDKASDEQLGKVFLLACLGPLVGGLEAIVGLYPSNGGI